MPHPRAIAVAVILSLAASASAFAAPPTQPVTRPATTPANLAAIAQNPTRETLLRNLPVLVNAAHAQIDAIPKADDRDPPLALLAEACARHGDLVAANRALLRISNPRDRHTCAGNITRILVDAAKFDAASDWSQRNKGGFYDFQAQRLIHRIRTGQTIVDPLREIDRMQGPGKASALIALAEAKLAAGDKSGAASLRKRAMIDAQRVNPPASRAMVLRDAAAAYARAGDKLGASDAYEAALTALTDLEPNQTSIRVEPAVARARIAELHGSIALTQATTGDLNAARRTARSIAQKDARAVTLARIAAFVHAADPAAARAMFDEALGLSDEIADPVVRIPMLCEVAVCLASVKLDDTDKVFAVVVDVAKKQPKPETRASMLGGISIAMLRAGRIEVARTTLALERTEIDNVVKSGQAPQFAAEAGHAFARTHADDVRSLLASVLSERSATSAYRLVGIIDGLVRPLQPQAE